MSELYRLGGVPQGWPIHPDDLIEDGWLVPVTEPLLTREEAANDWLGTPIRIQKLDIVLAPVPDKPEQYFVEVEDMDGNSVKLGEYVLRDDGFHAIRIEAVLVRHSSGSPMQKVTDNE